MLIFIIFCSVFIAAMVIKAKDDHDKRVFLREQRRKRVR